jgi:LysM repeat protein
MNNMKQYWLGLACGAALLASSSLNAADTKTYQVTGPVLEVTPTTITVQKGNDKWEIARDSKTKITGDLKVGAKVTIYYTMTATEVEVKEAKAKKK